MFGGQKVPKSWTLNNQEIVHHIRQKWSGNHLSLLGVENGEKPSNDSGRDRGVWLLGNWTYYNGSYIETLD